MSKLLMLSLVAFLAASTAYAQAPRGEALKYYSLLERVKNSDKSVDFKALRLLYTETPDYNPYGAPIARGAMYEALNNKDYKKAVENAQVILGKNYVDIDAHHVCSIAYEEMKDMEKSNFHSFVSGGLINSILNSGDGRSPETAFVVIETDEEYVIIAVLGAALEKQRLEEHNGHRYDVMEVKNPQTGETAVMYFNVDIPFGWMNRQFQK